MIKMDLVGYDWDKETYVKKGEVTITNGNDCIIIKYNGEPIGYIEYKCNDGCNDTLEAGLYTSPYNNNPVKIEIKQKKLLK
jgi:hypothetical protein